MLSFKFLILMQNLIPKKKLLKHISYPEKNIKGKAFYFSLKNLQVENNFEKSKIKKILRIQNAKSKGSCYRQFD